MKSNIHRSWLVCVVFLSACSTMLVQPAPEADDSAAKTFQPIPGRALLYVYRSSALGGDYATDVRVNGKSVAKNAYKRFVVLSLVPGHYRMDSHAFLYSEQPMEMDASEGAVRFYEEVWNFTQGFSLQERNPDAAKAAVARLSLASRVEVASP